MMKAKIARASAFLGAIVRRHTYNVGERRSRRFGENGKSPKRRAGLEALKGELNLTPRSPHSSPGSLPALILNEHG